MNPWLVTLIGLGAASLIRVVFHPIWGNEFMFVTYHPAVMLATIVAGWRYGLVATAISAAPLAGVLWIGLGSAQRGGCLDRLCAGERHADSIYGNGNGSSSRGGAAGGGRGGARRGFEAAHGAARAGGG